MFKKILAHLLTNILLISALIGVYINLPESYQSIDNRLRDFMFISRGKQPDSGAVRIVTIDEESLAELGQWPWERNKVATMLQNLTAAGATVIGMDVFFSEQDKSSPQNIIQSLQLDNSVLSKLEVPDYDQTMADMLSKTPTVLGYIFDLQNDRNLDNFPMINAVISETNFDGHDFLPVSKGVTLNLDKFQDKAMSSGFINNIPDSSGMIRRVPLLIKYQDIVFTSLAMEIFRLITATEEIKVHYHPTGISSLELVKEGESSFIPTDRHGRLFLNFLGPQKSFKYISAKDVISNKFNHDLVKDKVVLFGATSVGLMDLRAIPFDNALPGIEVHATAIENMLKQNYLQNPDWTEGANIVFLLIITVLLTILYGFLPAHLIFVMMGLALYGLYLFFDYLLFQQGLILNILFPAVSIILLTINSTLLHYFLESRQRKMIRDNFARKVSTAVVDEILKNDSKDLLLAQEKEVTIFFSDIRGFTNISETLDSPTKLIDVLNIYMTPMVESIMASLGTVDKFIGDAIMAYWNAPHSVDNHADLAIDSALHQLEKLKLVNRVIFKKYQLTLDIGIGINTGVATVGEMGSKGRSDYTIIGDSVNLASRLEGLNKIYGSQLLISEFTLKQVKNFYVIRELDKVRVKGKKEGVSIYEVLSKIPLDAEAKKELDEYNEALAYYFKGDFKSGKDSFEALVNKNADSKLYLLYLQRCETFIRMPPKDFDGVYTFTTK